MVLTVWTMLPFHNIIHYVKCISGWQATALALHSSTPSPEQTQHTADGMHFISFLSEISVLYVLSVVCTQNQFLTTTSPLQNHRKQRSKTNPPSITLCFTQETESDKHWSDMKYIKWIHYCHLWCCFIVTHYNNICQIYQPLVLINPCWYIFESDWSILEYQKYGSVVHVTLSHHVYTRPPLPSSGPWLRTVHARASRVLRVAHRAQLLATLGPARGGLSAALPLQWACSAPARWYEHFVSQISTLVLAQSR